jgi:hypothetical protein
MIQEYMDRDKPSAEHKMYYVYFICNNKSQRNSNRSLKEKFGSQTRKNIQ